MPQPPPAGSSSGNPERLPDLSQRHGQSPTRTGMRGLPRSAMALRAARRLVTPRACAIVMAAVAAWGATAGAQGVRITGSTISRYVEIRPLVTDSVPIDSTRGTGPVREAFTRGVAVQCAP